MIDRSINEHQSTVRLESIPPTAKTHYKPPHPGISFTSLSSPAHALLLHALPCYRTTPGPHTFLYLHINLSNSPCSVHLFSYFYSTFLIGKHTSHRENP